MTFRMSSALGVVLLAGVLAASASAQTEYKGKFRLPVETSFGGVVLEPGDYTISLARVGTDGTDVVRIDGTSGFASMLATSSGIAPYSNHGSLKLVSVGGKYVLREYNAGTIGKSFTFRIPKEPRSSAAHGGAPRDATVVTVN